MNLPDDPTNLPNEHNNSKIMSSQECVEINVPKCVSNKTEVKQLSYKDILLKDKKVCKDTRSIVFAKAPQILTSLGKTRNDTKTIKNIS